MLGPGLFLFQKQLQILKPQQILFASLLQLPMLLLEQKIQMELHLNPVLEEAEEWEAVQENEDDELEEKREEAEKIQEEFAALAENSKSEEDKRNDQVQEDVDLKELLPGDDDLPEPRMPVNRNEEIRDLPEPYHATMSEHLLDQLQLLNLQEIDFRIGEYIIYSLRDDDYLDFEVTADSIAQIFETSSGEIERVLRFIQELEPPGIAARSLQECLIIQLYTKNKNGRHAIPCLFLKKEKVESAKWFLKAIGQRRATMQRTMEAIVDKQRMFFEDGPENIKPMIMKDIAEIIEMDISTVSRVCKGKYVDTDYGVFELKYFFLMKAWRQMPARI